MRGARAFGIVVIVAACSPERTYDDVDGLAGGSGVGGNAGRSSAGAAGTGVGASGAGSAGDGGGGSGGTPLDLPCGAPDQVCCEDGSCVPGASCNDELTCRCDEGLDVCPIACTNLQTDAQNCGTCGRDCLGGSCEAGVCQATVVVASGDMPKQAIKEIAVDDTYVYWIGTPSGSSMRKVYRQRHDAGDEVVELTPTFEPGQISGLSLGAGRLFWMYGGQVRTCPAPDCPGGPTDLIPPVQAGIAGGETVFRDGKLYFTQESYSSTQHDGAFWSVPVPPGAPAKVGPHPVDAVILAADASNVYWGAQSSYYNSSINRDAGIYKMNVSTGVVVALASHFTAAAMTSMAAGGSFLYVDVTLQTDAGSAHHYLKLPLPNGIGSSTTPPTFTIGTAPLDLVADDRHVYFAEYTASGAIRRCPHSGCATPPEIVGAAQTYPTALAQDARSIYWASGSVSVGSDIFRIAK